MDNEITIAICNFNTTELTNTCIQSIYDKSGLQNIKFIVFDNSHPSNKFCIFDALKMLNIQIIDNTLGKIIDFNSALERFSKISINANKNGSLKHCMSIQFLLNICTTRDMLLFDSDVILLKQLDFIDPQYITIADLEKHGDKCDRSPTGVYPSKTRFLPFIQYFNCDAINKNHLAYFQPNYIHGGLSKAGNYYDTGASFYRNVVNANLPYKQIQYKNYINHLNHGSWTQNKA